MERADAEFEKGEYEKARDFFSRALDGYMQVEALAPDYKNGLPTLRIHYCASQITNAVAALVGDPMPEEPVESAAEAFSTARELPEASRVQAAPAPGTTAHAVVSAIPESGQIASKDSQKAQSRPHPSVTAATPVRKLDGAPAVSGPVAKPVTPVYDARNYIHDFNEARVLLEEGFLSEAADILVPLLHQDPGNRSIRLMIAIVRTRQGRFDEAIGALEDLRGRQEDLPILLAISGAYLGAGRYPDALLALDRAVKLAPDDPNAYMNLAWLSLVMPGCGRDAIPNAEAYYRQAIIRGAARDRALEKRIGLMKW